MNCSELECFPKHSNLKWGKILNGLLKIINVNLAMKLESNFVCSWSQNGIYMPNCLLFSSCLAISNVSNGWSLLYKAFHWFLAFLGFRVFCYRPYSKIQKSRKVLACYFSKGWTLFVSKYCSKLSMKTENWILRQFSSFAKVKWYLCTKLITFRN